MIELTREVRFCLTAAEHQPKPPGNSWSGSAACSTLTPYITLRCTVAGELEKKSSYVCNIKLIDGIVRENVVDAISRRLAEFQTAKSILEFAKVEILHQLPTRLQLVRLVCKTNPFVGYTWDLREPNMISFTEQFEFSASHRLHNPELNDKENRELFGKCNHPSGHGHNYLVDVTIIQNSDLCEVFDESGLQKTVKHLVIDRLDHKHLNQDIAAFKDLNPTVENIAKTIFDWLKGDVEPAKLHSIRVYETPKTWAEIRASD